MQKHKINTKFKLGFLILAVFIVIMVLSIHVYSNTIVGVRILGNISDGCVADEYCLPGLSCINDVCMSNYTINLTVVNSTLQPIPALIEIWKDGGLIYSTNNTNSSYDLFYANKYNISIETNYSNCSNIIINNVLNEDDSVILWGISDVPLDHTVETFEQICSINPLINEFEDYDLTILHDVGDARAIYKCVNWNFSERECIDEVWEKIKIIQNDETQTIIQGLNSSDPGFGIKSCCGDGICDLNEDISICSEDCGTEEDEQTQTTGGNSGILYLPPTPAPTSQLLKVDLITKNNAMESLKENQKFIILHPQGDIEGYLESVSLHDITLELTKGEKTQRVIITNQALIDVALDPLTIKPYVRLGYFEFREKDNVLGEDTVLIYFENIFSEEYKKPEYIPYVDYEEDVQYPFDFYLTREDVLLILLLGALFFAYPIFAKKECSKEYAEEEIDKKLE